MSELVEPKCRVCGKLAEDLCAGCGRPVCQVHGEFKSEDSDDFYCDPCLR